MKPNLEREKVVATALELLNEVGFEGLTLRRLADKLGVKAAALYWHFENKQDLVDQVATQIITNEFAGQEIPENASWRQVLSSMAHGMRSALGRYRDGASVIANADMRKNRYKGRDVVLNALARQGFSEDLALTAMFTIGRFNLGSVFEEQADPRPRIEGGVPSDNAMWDPDVKFQQGLDIILAGIEHMLHKTVT